MEEVNQTWLDYTLENNLSGVMKVLADYGFIGMLAPQTVDEVRESCFELMDQYGDQGVIALFNAHPEFPVFEEIYAKRTPQYYSNAIEGVSTKITSFVSRLRPIDQAFVALGVFIGAYYILQETKKK